MRKIFITFLLAVAVCALVCGCGIAPEARGVSNATISSWHGNTETAPPTYVSPEPKYDSNVDYMSLMVQYAARGDTDALKSAVTSRNAKIAEQNLGGEVLTTQEFLDNFEQYAGFSLDKNYLAEMVACCVSGDIEAGREAEMRRNLKIDVMGTDDRHIIFDDLYLLAKVITNEAGCWWLPMDWKIAVGEVLLNRVASVEFPNTISECVYQEGQYAGVYNSKFQNMTPFEDCVEAAARLMRGERVLNEPSAVFQSGGKKGSGVHLKLYDELMGYTYICYSSYPELYE